MKYCAHCGNELLDEAIICPKCGCSVGGSKSKVINSQDQKDLILVIKILMIVSCVVEAIAFLLTLAWTLPMTLSVKRCLENRQPIGLGFKICVLLFVSLIAGVLLLIVNTDDYVA